MVKVVQGKYSFLSSASLSGLSRSFPMLISLYSLAGVGVAAYSLLLIATEYASSYSFSVIMAKGEELLTSCILCLGTFLALSISDCLLIVETLLNKALASRACVKVLNRPIVMLKSDLVLSSKKNIFSRFDSLIFTFANIWNICSKVV